MPKNNQDEWDKQYLKEKNAERDLAIDNAIAHIIESKACTKCGSGLRRIGKVKLGCCSCTAQFKLKHVPPKPIDLSDSSKWWKKCDECGAKAYFMKGGACGAYICQKCGECYEV